MKKRIVTLSLCLCMLISVFAAAVPAVAVEAPFTDIDGVKWAEEAILWGYENGIVAGTEEGKFSPNMPLNRAMFATMLTRLSAKLGYNTTTNVRGYIFFDVKSSGPTSWYTSSVNWMSAVGAMQGCGNNSDGKPVFEPLREITRQEMAVGLNSYLTNLVAYNATPAPNDSFRDMSKAGAWARDGILKMTGCGLLSGVGDGLFSPLGRATRAEAISIIYRAFKLIALPENLQFDDTRDDRISLALTQRFRVLASDSFKQASDLWTIQNGEIKDGALTLQNGTASAPSFETTCGALSFRASVTPGETAFAGFAANGDQPAVNLFSMLDTVDAEPHEYTLLWLDNGVYVAFVDGVESGRIGSTDIMMEDEDIPASVLFRGSLTVEDMRVFRFETPLSRYGAISVDGANMFGKTGEIAQLFGANVFVNDMNRDSSTFNEYLGLINYETMRWMRDDWGLGVFRMMIELDHLDGHSYGYIDRPEWRDEYRDYIYEVAEIARRLGIYIIVDWHVVSWGNYTSNPFEVMDEAKEFFDLVSTELRDYDNVFYEPANEPSTEYWSVKDGKTERDYDETLTLKYYHEQLADVIHANDPDALIIASSPNACNSIHLCAKDPMDPERFPNVVYVCHTYPKNESFGGRMMIHYIDAVRARLPVFITEFGYCSISEADDDNGIDVLDPDSPDFHSLYAWLTQFDTYGTGYIFLPFQRLIFYNDRLSRFRVDEMEEGAAYIREWYREQSGYNR